MLIKEISMTECFPLWDQLWITRVSAITPTSAMLLCDDEHRKYSTDVGEPIFLGAYVDGELVGCNSLHRIENTTRSRGLYVNPQYRKMGIGKALLEETIRRGEGTVWSFPRKEALNTYLSAGFSQHTDLMWDETEKKWNCYVKIDVSPR